MIQALLKTIETLRSENGCPWDLKQTHESLLPYLIEECYETVDAYYQDRPSFASELGDVLLQIVLHCQIAKEEGNFDFDHVAALLNKKMIRRHPHVFANTKVEDADEVAKNWEIIKRSEKKSNCDPSILNGIPKSMPALLKAYRLGQKTAAVGFDWARTKDVLAKVDEEVAELKDAVINGQQSDIELEFGDILFSLASLARHLKINPEQACEKANRKFQRRFREIETTCEKQKKDLATLTDSEWNAAWEQVKSSES